MSKTQKIPANTASRAATDARELMRLVHEATAPVTGNDYFRSLVVRLAETLNVEVALVTECLEYPSSHVRTLAYFESGQLNEDIEFDVVGTPCEDVIRGGEFCFYPDSMGQRFPEWAREEGGVESFIGVPVHAPADGRVIGHIAVFHRHPMAQQAVVESVFRIIAARAGAEMQRLQAEQARRDSEHAARQHLAELAHVSRLSSMGEMASAVAHEINQPITAILTWCQAGVRMQERGETDPAQLRHVLDRIMESAGRTTEMVRRLRDYVKRREPQKTPVRIEQLLQECGVLLEAEAHQHGVELEISVSQRLPPVEADSMLLQQVILNLARNGMDAMQGVAADARRLTVRAEGSTDHGVTVTVSDSGPGVAPGVLAHLFEPFVSTRESGMGIGLSLCRSIIDDHGGRLWLDSQATDGATFCFCLPPAEQVAS